MVCEEIGFDRSLPLDLPNVVVDGKRAGVKICGSKKWGKFHDLSSLFVGILSHESIHLTLMKEVGNLASDCLDLIGSLSAISKSLSDIALVGKYKHGLIGIDLI